MLLRLIAVFCLFCISPACAGAWTLAEDTSQSISNFTYSRASRSYDGASNPTIPVRYTKLLTQTYIEYGLRDWITLTVNPEYARAKSGTPGGPVEIASAFAIGGGARVRLLEGENVLSVEASFKSAGAFDTNVSVNQESGRQIELRALYGINFEVFGKPAFADFETGHRFVAGARPDEAPVDITVGLHLTSGTMLLAQNFNVISHGNYQRPYRAYRSHKLQLSVVQHVWRSLSVQIGAFVSPFGQRTLKEQGLSFALWERM
ncbi:MAG TPA: hypothetical protein VL026_01790 [Rhizomicrobium sp.]|nr:hypothetical protein [Rhizomicrobium sp.]